MFPTGGLGSALPIRGKFSLQLKKNLNQTKQGLCYDCSLDSDCWECKAAGGCDEFSAVIDLVETSCGSEYWDTGKFW